MEELNTEHIHCLAYADDLMIITHSLPRMHEALILVEKWAASHEVSLNKEKSAILVARADKKTRERLQEIRGIKITHETKYLGVEISNDFKCGIQVQKLRKLRRDMKYRLQQQWAAGMPQHIRFHIWQTLFQSKAAYGNFILVQACPKIATQMASTMYESMRVIFGFRSYPKKENLLPCTLGMTGMEYVTLRSETSKADARRDPECKAAWTRLEECHAHIKRLVQHNAGIVLQYQTGHYIQTYAPKDKQGIKRKRICACRQTLHQAHATTCPVLEETWKEAIAGTKFTSTTELKRTLARTPVELMDSRQMQRCAGVLEHLRKKLIKVTSSKPRSEARQAQPATHAG